MDWMQWIPAAWAILGVILFGVEFLLPGFIIAFFGFGALVTALLTFLIPPLASNFILSSLIWMGTSIGSLFALRSKFAPLFTGKLLKEDKLEYAGEKAMVIETISPDKKGRIKFLGTTWDAESQTETFKTGEEVEILKKEGLHFIVTHSLTE